MSYKMSGHFIESCDCTVICPCWVDDDPVGGHCTGFIAWQIEEDKTALVNGTPVGGCRVVSVATHAGNRRDGNNTTTMLYVQTCPEEAADEDEKQLTSRQFLELVELFSGRSGGPLAELSQVSGTVVGARRARIEVNAAADINSKDNWSVVVRPHTGAPPTTVAIHAQGHPTIFDITKGNTKALTLENTAISYELSAVGSVAAQHGDRLVVNVGALPAGNLEVIGRSGMRGRFSYDVK